MLPLLSLAIIPFALAAPHAESLHFPIIRRSTSPAERIANLPSIMDGIRLKYGYTTVNRKRAVTTASITDEVCLFRILSDGTHIPQENDSSYSAVVSIGTPYVTLLLFPPLSHLLLLSAQEFNLILDTGKLPSLPLCPCPLIPTQVLLICGSLPPSVVTAPVYPSSTLQNHRRTKMVPPFSKSPMAPVKLLVSSQKIA